MKVDHLERLVNAVMSNPRDTMREAQLAGKVDAYETMLMDLDRFTKEQIEQAQ